MRIEQRPLSAQEKLRKGKKKDSEGVSFLEVLQGSEDVGEINFDPENVTQDDLRNLAGLIEQVGEQLANNPTPENFTKYKGHIKLFIKLLQENLEVRDTVSRISFAKQKLYKTVEQIDDGLAEMARSMLSGEKSRIHYLKLAQSIKGLIVDLIL